MLRLVRLVYIATPNEAPLVVRESVQAGRPFGHNHGITPLRRGYPTRGTNGACRGESHSLCLRRAGRRLWILEPVDEQHLEALLTGAHVLQMHAGSRRVELPRPEHVRRWRADRDHA